MTTYCAHSYQPLWRVDTDGLGRLVCATCGAPLTPKPTRDMDPFEVYLLAAALLVALVGAAWWFWWTWLS